MTHFGHWVGNALSRVISQGERSTSPERMRTNQDIYDDVLAGSLFHYQPGVPHAEPWAVMRIFQINDAERANHLLPVLRL